MIKLQIGTNAGKIWQLIDESQITSVFEIEKALSMQRQDVLMELGWLACENKIHFLSEDKDSKIIIIY